jgi:hypothetical protein
MGSFTNWTERDAALHNAKVSGNLKQSPASSGVEREKELQIMKEKQAEFLSKSVRKTAPYF